MGSPAVYMTRTFAHRPPASPSAAAGRQTPTTPVPPAARFPFAWHGRPRVLSTHRDSTLADHTLRRDRTQRTIRFLDHRPQPAHAGRGRLPPRDDPRASPSLRALA